MRVQGPPGGIAHSEERTTCCKVCPFPVPKLVYPDQAPSDITPGKYHWLPQHLWANAKSPLGGLGARAHRLQPKKHFKQCSKGM